MLGTRLGDKLGCGIHRLGLGICRLGLGICRLELGICRLRLGICKLTNNLCEIITTVDKDLLQECLYLYWNRAILVPLSQAKYFERFRRHPTLDWEVGQDLSCSLLLGSVMEIWWMQWGLPPWTQWGLLQWGVPLASDGWIKVPIYLFIFERYVMTNYGHLKTWIAYRSRKESIKQYLKELTPINILPLLAAFHGTKDRWWRRLDCWPVWPISQHSRYGEATRRHIRDIPNNDLRENPRCRID